jgi:hypothetical protein
MSVMACSRVDCGNIMCDRYSSQHGYICGECFDELVHRGAGTDVAAFMESPTNLNATEADFAYFNALFQLGDD